MLNYLRMQNELVLEVKFDANCFHNLKFFLNLYLPLISTAPVPLAANTKSLFEM